MGSTGTACLSHNNVLQHDRFKAEFAAGAGQLLYDLGHAIDNKRVQTKGPQQSIACTKSYHGLREMARVDEALHRLIFALWPRLLEVTQQQILIMMIILMMIITTIIIIYTYAQPSYQAQVCAKKVTSLTEVTCLLLRGAEAHLELFLTKSLIVNHPGFYVILLTVHDVKMLAKTDKATWSCNASLELLKCLHSANLPNSPLKTTPYTLHTGQLGRLPYHKLHYWRLQQHPCAGTQQVRQDSR